MAFVKEIDRKCHRGDCASGAVVQVIAEDFTVVGDFCRPHGREAQKEQDAKEKGKATTRAPREATARG
jgi:hypothetical protein